MAGYMTEDQKKVDKFLKEIKRISKFKNKMYKSRFTRLGTNVVMSLCNHNITQHF